MDKFDVVVIGAGPAGYVAAIRCAQLGLKTACVDDWLDENAEPAPGGTCLNVGCIPSKALLESTELFERSQHTFAEHGIKIKTLGMDLEQMLKRKTEVVKSLTGGVSSLFRAHNIHLYSGRGTLLDKKQVEVVQGDEQTLQLQAKHIILAPGSKPRELENVPFDQQNIVDSSAALAFSPVPERLAVIGAGIIALELGSVWRRLGAEVTLFKSSETFLPNVDETIARQARQLFEKQGLQFKFATQINRAIVGDDGVTLKYQRDGKKYSKTFDKILVAVGRIPNTAGIARQETGLALDEKDRIIVDDQCRTNLPDVYAIGDAVRGPMLAHKGSEEGLMVANLIAGKFARVNYDAIPFVMYTEPELAWCGLTEQQLRQQGIAYRVGSFNLAGNPRARAMGMGDGLVKVLADASTDRVLGVHMLGHMVSELIGQGVQAMEFSASSEDLAMGIFAHPTLSEALHEASLDVRREAIHKLRAGG